MHDLGHKKYKYQGGDPIGPDGIEKMMTITKEMIVKNNLESLEHIDVRVWISHTKRGDVEVEIESPNGIKSILASTREYDEADTGFPGWRFMTLKHWGENPVGEWTLRVFDQDDPEQHGKFLGWNMAFWGSAIDPAKAVKFVEPAVDNALPPADFPPRPVPNDPDVVSSTEYSKPTDHLPSDHGHATGENSRPAFPAPTGRPKPQQDEDEPSKAWYSHMASLVAAQKWFFAALGAVTVFAVGSIVYFWRRRVARQRLANYTSLAADDIGMDAIGQNRVIAGSGGPRTTRALYDSFGQPSSDDLPAPAQPNVNPPSARGLGFHSGFLDDDEPSAGLTPKYRDEPETRQPTGIQRRSLDDYEEVPSPRRSADGSRERLAGDI
jgi:kexin